MKKENNQDFNPRVMTIFALVACLFVVVGYAQAAPSSPPQCPSGECPAPINVGSVGQNRTGSLGIGTYAPTRMLDVVGGAIGGNYALVPGYVSWSDYAGVYGTGDGAGSIYNDDVSYKNLFIVGNNSENTALNVYKVGIWDFLTLHGFIKMNGNLVKNVSTPLSANDAANRKYVDDKFSSILPSSLPPSGLVANFPSGSCPLFGWTLFYGNGVNTYCRKN
jgi:hypothetical protein